MASEQEQKGIRAFRDGDYPSALDHFSLAISITTKRNIPGSTTSAILHRLYGLRASTHGKLGDTHVLQAMNDARAMIRLDGRHPAGYLCLAKFQARVKRFKEALRTISMGSLAVEGAGGGAGGKGLKRKRGEEEVSQEEKERLKHVPQLLAMQKQLEALAEKQKAAIEEGEEPELKDPLTMLPLELAEQTFKQLDFRTLIRCQRVCKGWNNYVKNIHISTFEHLDFTHARLPPKGTLYTAYLKLSQRPSFHPIRTLTLSKLQPEKVTTLFPNLISAIARTLDTLHLTPTFPAIPRKTFKTLAAIPNHIKSLQFDCPVKLYAVVEMVAYLKCLESLECHQLSINEFGVHRLQHTKLPKLKHLVMNAQLDPGEPCITRNDPEMSAAERQFTAEELEPPPGYRPFQHIPNLETLKLYGWGMTNIAPGWNFRHLRNLKVFESIGNSFQCFPLVPASVEVLAVAENSHTPRSRVVMERFLRLPCPKLRVLLLRKNKCIQADHLYEILREKEPVPEEDEEKGEEEEGEGVGMAEPASIWDAEPTPNNLPTTANPSPQPPNPSEPPASETDPPLTHLDISHCPNLTYNTLSFLTSHPLCHNLHYLNLSHHPSFNDSTSLELLPLRKLQHLEINYTNISGIGLVNIAATAGRENGRGGVGFISAVGCGRLMRDAVEKVRREGVVVRYLEVEREKAKVRAMNKAVVGLRPGWDFWERELGV